MRPSGELIIDINSLDGATLDNPIEDVGVVEDMNTIEVLLAKVLNGCFDGMCLIHPIRYIHDDPLHGTQGMVEQTRHSLVVQKLDHGAIIIVVLIMMTTSPQGS